MFGQIKKLLYKVNLNKDSLVHVMFLVCLGNFPAFINCTHSGMDLLEHSGQVSVVYPLIAGLLTGSKGDDNYKAKVSYRNPPTFWELSESEMNT